MRIKSNKIKDIIRFAQEELNGIYSENEIKQMTNTLITHFCNIPLISIVADKEQTILESELLKLNFAIKDLKKEKPLQYIIGETTFYNITIKLNHNVLIPRPETEELVDMIIKENKEKARLKIADLGAGSGAIALSLKNNLPQSEVWAFDNDDNAIVQIKENKDLLGLDIRIEKADILKERFTEEKFDIIVSNPPYVMEKEKALIKNNVLNYEPHKALFVSDNNPLIYYKAIERFAKNNLLRNGKIYLEINEALGKETLEVFKDYNSSLLKDINNKDRFVIIKK